MDNDGDGYVDCSLDVDPPQWADLSFGIIGGDDCNDDIFNQGVIFPNNLMNTELDFPTGCYLDQTTMDMVIVRLFKPYRLILLEQIAMMETSLPIQGQWNFVTVHLKIVLIH